MEIVKATIVLPRHTPSRYYVPLPNEVSYRAVTDSDVPSFLQVVAVYEVERLLDRETAQYRFVGVNVTRLPTTRAADGAIVCACEQPLEHWYLRCAVCGGEFPPRR